MWASIWDMSSVLSTTSVPSEKLLEASLCSPVRDREPGWWHSVLICIMYSCIQAFKRLALLSRPVRHGTRMCGLELDFGHFFLWSCFFQKMDVNHCVWPSKKEGSQALKQYTASLNTQH